MDINLPSFTLIQKYFNVWAREYGIEEIDDFEQNQLPFGLFCSPMGIMIESSWKQKRGDKSNWARYPVKQLSGYDLKYGTVFASKSDLSITNEMYDELKSNGCNKIAGEIAWHCWDYYVVKGESSNGFGLIKINSALDVKVCFINLYSFTFE